jgi:hypothetical protein
MGVEGIKNGTGNSFFGGRFFIKIIIPGWVIALIENIHSKKTTCV